MTAQIEEISKHFPEYEEVIKCKKLNVGEEYWEECGWEEYDLKEYKRIKKLYNDRMVELLIEYFGRISLGKAKIAVDGDQSIPFMEYKKIIDRYVKL